MVSLRGSLLLGLLVTCNVLLVQCALNLNMNVEDMEKRYYNGRALDIPLGEEGTHELHGHWIGQALSGLMAAVATERAENIAKHHRDELFACSKKASDIHQHAKCVVKSLDAPDHKEEKVIQVEEAKAEDNDVQWVGGMAVARAKRSAGPRVVSKSSYTLNDDNDANPFAMLAKHLTSTVRAMKHKKGAESWHETLLKVKKLEHQQKEEDAKRDALKKRLRSMIEAMPENVDTTHKQQALKQLEEVEHPKNMTDVEAKKEAIRIPMQLMREAVKIGMQLTGKNVSHFDDKTIKMVSPRFFSVVPDQDNDETVNLISPSLFSLHEDGDELERVLSLPGLFKRMNLKGQDAWMDFIIEASGVGDIVEDKLKKDEPNAKRDKELRGSREAETQKVETFEKLDKSYSKDQIAEMDKRGYTFLSNDQLDLVYGDDSPYKSNHFREGFKNISKEQQLDFIINNIRGIAAAKPNRTKRAIEFSPFILQNLVFVGQTLSQPVTLSPLVLSPITLSPAVLGPITLSPWVFIPLILSPRVLSPLIVSPLVGSPIILSPLVLHPLILVPGVLNPFILSPFVLSPFILSPQALTPLILSPFALSPLILTPMVLSPLILSPFVLSPIILSPQTLFAVVLSPYALSPLIESKLTASEVVLSPSWLS
ncbi:hypothetical protein QR680_000292 [Steinernema hermaphroditum]|uniref:Uncharacterized protein n=1 Tax=Steinernema hermaphroditum TaxID=289476 RepID=A0AA39LDS9_9BILA|nr:hypothetical protein QR680_000292 [Steinernema hermaphroditum]